MKSIITIYVGLVVALITIGQVSNAEQSVKAKQSVKKSSSKKNVGKKKRPTKSVDAAGKVKKSDVSEGAKLQTDISFNDSTLHGRYQTPDEANVKVENEKVLRDLLAVRTNFKDRLKKSSEQN